MAAFKIAFTFKVETIRVTSVEFSAPRAPSGRRSGPRSWRSNYPPLQTKDTARPITIILKPETGYKWVAFCSSTTADVCINDYTCPLKLGEGSSDFVFHWRPRPGRSPRRSLRALTNRRVYAMFKHIPVQIEPDSCSVKLFTFSSR